MDLRQIRQGGLQTSFFVFNIVSLSLTTHLFTISESQRFNKDVNSQHANFCMLFDSFLHLWYSVVEMWQSLMMFKDISSETSCMKN